MKIRMLGTQAGSPDGATTLLYEKGREYELGTTMRELDLAAVFLHYGWAEEVGATVVAPPEPVAPEPVAPVVHKYGKRR